MHLLDLHNTHQLLQKITCKKYIKLITKLMEFYYLLTQNATKIYKRYSKWSQFCSVHKLTISINVHIKACVPLFCEKGFLFYLLSQWHFLALLYTWYIFNNQIKYSTFSIITERKSCSLHWRYMPTIKISVSKSCKDG